MDEDMCPIDDVCTEEGDSAAEREAKRQEYWRLRCIDKPIESDPWGNGIIGAIGGGLFSAVTGIGSVLSTIIGGSGASRSILTEPFMPNPEEVAAAEERERCGPYTGMY